MVNWGETKREEYLTNVCCQYTEWSVEECAVSPRVSPRTSHEVSQTLFLLLLPPQLSSNIFRSNGVGSDSVISPGN